MEVQDMAEQQPRDVYRIDLEVLPDDRDVGVRLRQLLKHALRSQNLRCRKVERIEPHALAPAPQGHLPPAS